ncbi:MAG: hypothetical protein LAT67_05645 [Balneolales bacterium]|nr:hypothetical protein [Balneolales bacterium]
MPGIFSKKRNKIAGSTGSFRRYLSYTVGEIFLLVTGILIAVQVNSWNENRKRAALSDTYTEALLRDLNDDVASITRFIELYGNYSETLSAYTSRLSSPEATIDTVIYIARNDFQVSVPPFVNYNNSTYQTLLSTGDLDLLDVTQLRMLQQLYDLHEDELHFRHGNMDVLRSITKTYILSYTYEFGVINDGPLYDKIWENADHQELIPLLNSLLTLQSVMNMTSVQYYERILDKTMELINFIENG